MKGGWRYGAGRPGWKSKAEHHLNIDIRRWVREGKLKSNVVYFGYQWTRDGEKIGSIGVQVNKTDSLTLTYRRQNDADEWQDISFPICISWTRCNFGGERAWFVCPHCGRLAAKLYLTRNGWFCRRSLRLAYASQSEDAMSRMHRRVAKLESKLDEENMKPKGMRWKTYNRIIDKLDAAERRLDFAFLQNAATLVGKLRGL